MRVLGALAKACALLGGVMLMLIAATTCASVLGRNFLGFSLVGDFELTGVAAGLAVVLSMPWCQLTRNNIIVDFFTARATPKTTDRLDRVGALLLSCVMALLAWRTSLGGLNAWSNHSSSMLLGLPDWVVYGGMVPPLALTAAIGLWQAMLATPQPEPDGAIPSPTGHAA